jgi:hypothetical protein
MTEVSLLRDAWLRTSVHAAQTITIFEWRELPPLPYDPDIGLIVLSLLWSVRKEAYKDTSTPTRAAEMRQQAAEEEDQLLARCNTFSCSKADEDGDYAKK